MTEAGGSSVFCPRIKPVSEKLAFLIRQQAVCNGNNAFHQYLRDAFAS
jgi:hypothetical protein